MLKRSFDIIMSALGMYLLSPFLLLLSLALILNSGFPIFYFQERIGKGGHAFKLIKFRTMRTNSKGLQITLDKDPRITGVGNFLRKYKLDELPQLLNIFLGQMSFVGPRPEVRKYVELYTAEEKKIVSIKPGLTGLDSLNYSQESELLKNTTDPEHTYITEILPEKIKLNLVYLEKRNFGYDISIILATIKKIFS
ncbi:MAG TPA: glycosyl transferase [Flavobacteriales bacterium]|nr:glycosyl transferase [Flavobacteriales bacterium]|tara:strand:+ start:28921 stop:29505 length:585 start_codon:yes stop_codon:yes gene_type:complete